MLHLTVAKALEIPMVSKCKVLAGKNGLNRVIESVNSFDAPDVINWIKPKELVLTTGFVFQNNSNHLDQLVYELSEKQCAGLALKQKEIPETVINIANKADLPILQIPNYLSLSDIMFPLLREIVTVRNKNQVAIKKFESGDQISLSKEEYQKVEVFTILQYTPKKVLEDFIYIQLGPLLQHDEMSKSELVHTLDVYLHSNLRPAESARILGVHRNTMHFRIKSIKEILKNDLNQGEQLFMLQLALYAKRLLKN